MDVLSTYRFALLISVIVLIAGVSASYADNTESLGIVKIGAINIPVLDCVIEPSNVVDIGSAVPGVVGSIHAYRGELIKKGDVIVKIESSVEQAALKQAKLRAELDTSITLRQEAAKLGQLTQKRNQELLEKSAISVQDIDQLKAETRIAELQVKQEKDNKRIAQLEYRRTQAVLQQRTIRSPVDGVVMERFKSVGEYVDSEPLFRIAQIHPLHVEVIVPVDYLGLVSAGMEANVTSVVSGADSYLATVQRVDRVADAASGTYGVRLSIPNPDYSVPAGMRCRLSFLPPSENTSEEIASETPKLSEKEPEQGG